MRRWASVVRSRRNELARLLTREMGKVLAESSGEVDQGAVMMEWFAEEARRASSGEMLSSEHGGGNQRNLVHKRPVGIVFAITPWNFPFLAPVVKCAAAIAVGCAVVLKPSEETPLTALALARCARDAGLPDGVLQVLPCSDPAPVSDVLLASFDVRCLTFTGSTAVGRALYRSCADTLKRTSFELGGNAPFLVFEDADLEVAVGCAKGARFYNNGQICIGANRILVHEDVYEEFLRLYEKKVSALRTGDPLDPEVHTGPLVNEKALAKVRQLVDDAVSKGAVVVTGGLVGNDDENEDLHVRPTILRDVDERMDAYREEMFGPVACVGSFRSEEEAVSMANATPYGLAAYAFSADHARLWRLSTSLEAGMVGANTTDVCADDLPFGGIKQSGFGREGGVGCLVEFLETRTFCLGLLDSGR